MNPLRTGILLLSLGLAPSLSMQGQDGRDSPFGPRPTEPVLHLGITLGGGVVADRGGMEAIGFEGELASGDRYSSEEGSGRGYVVGVTGSIDVDSRWRITTSIAVDRRHLRYSMREIGATILVPSVEDPNNPTIVEAWRSTLELRMELTLLQSSIRADFLALSLSGVDLRLQAGLGAGFVLEGSEERRVEEQPDFVADHYPYLASILGPLPQSTDRRPIDNLSTAVLGLHGGVALELPVGPSLSILPALTWTHALTPLVSGSRWRSRTVGGRVDFLWKISATPDRP